MSEAFNDTPIVVGQMPTTYGEMRNYAHETWENTTASEVVRVAAHNPELVASAIRGLAFSITFLLDRVEELTRETEESK